MADPQNAGAAAALGRLTAIHGSVVDVRFPAGALPAIDEGIEIERDEPSAGRRGSAASRSGDRARGGLGQYRRTEPRREGAAIGGPIRVPVGDAVLGRLLNAVGEPADRGPPLPADTSIGRSTRRPLPRSARRRPQIFHTGIKVIDLLAPLVKGGKAAMFGGAGVGKTVLIMELIRTTVERHSGNFGVRRHRRTLARRA